ncbi:MAG: AraC family transcriptional regulator [Hydrogenophaga sp.]|jgi:AraC-like DNA-binding protein|uniref:AraC family transcriptional regulator n=1 Tax=Hydrogenophaga sp. TaxID=1904254 RepID=UPI000ECEE07C|nr:AraC family transcriptional regulator [Hydrogenophaga sp.]MDD3784177.1 AraC family transcriptional regulator [Hydrogenophaga sp.]HAJ11502.1 AraC family transcriptional regulator [Comamonadaceae bacterium]
MPGDTPIDRLSGVLERFRVQAQLHHTGALCGLSQFDASGGHGYLHVLRRGRLEVSHPAARGVPRRLRFDEPALLFYPRPFTHRFHNPPVEGADFTCARLVFDGGAENPLARALPPVIALPLARVPGLDLALELLFAETDRVRCGHRLLADRLFEVVVLQLLRWLLDHPQEAGVRPGLITGLSDPRLARALVAMHERPGEAWTLERMAGSAGMSRTAFANTFREAVGQTPADYLAGWRIALAQSRLREGRPIKLLAQELGYANPSALSRAFSAKVGASPRAWLADRLTDQSTTGSGSSRMPKRS